MIQAFYLSQPNTVRLSRRYSRHYRDSILNSEWNGIIRLNVLEYNYKID